MGTLVFELYELSAEDIALVQGNTLTLAASTAPPVGAGYHRGTHPPLPAVVEQGGGRVPEGVVNVLGNEAEVHHCKWPRLPVGETLKLLVVSDVRRRNVLLSSRQSK
jgi:hypothetical protein